jgi:tetratricopeptide (TPR) repeat protein
VLLAAAYTLRPQSADGRLFIWRASVGLVRAKPITGHGLGSFPAKYDGAQADYLRTEGLPDAWTRNAATPEYAFNEYIQIATEHGIVGLLLFVGMVAMAFGFRTHHQPDSCAMAVRGSLTAFLVFAFFSYPFSVLPLIVLFVMLMAMSATEVPPVGITLSQFSNIAVGILCLWLVGYASAEILARYPAYRAWSRVQMDYDSGYFAKAIAPYHRLYPKLAHEKTFLYEYARCLALTGRYPESNNELDRYLLLGSDPAIYYRKADNYRRMADYGAAERMYLRSLEMLPNRFHTLRLLLNLYDETGQTEKSQKIREMMERRWRRPIKERRGE